MNRSFRLWVAHFLQCKSKDHTFLACQEEGAEFCFGGCRDDEFKYLAEGEKRPVEFDGLRIDWKGAQEEVAASVASSVVLRPFLMVRRDEGDRRSVAVVSYDFPSLWYFF